MTRWPSVLFLLTALPVLAEGVADKLTVAGIKEFTAAYQAWDGARFAAAAELLRQATTNSPPSATRFYWLGVAHFHRMLQLQHQPKPGTNASAAPAALDAALTALKRAAKLDERQAESHALLGTLYGMKIDGNLARAAWYGPRIEKHRKTALRLGADNPRVLYLLGVCQFHTARKPADWRAALKTLLTAEKIFEVESNHANTPLDPRWGGSSCLTFIGRTYEHLGEPAMAAQYFRKALTAHPADCLAKEGLARVMGKP